MSELSALKAVLPKAVELAFKKIMGWWGFEEEVEKLKKQLEMTNAIFERARIEDEPVKIWFNNIERVTNEANNVLDEIHYEILRRDIEKPNTLKSIYWQMKMAKRIESVNKKFEVVNAQARSFGLQEFTGACLAFQEYGGGSCRESVSFTVDRTFVGRDKCVSQIVEVLTNQQDEANPFVLSVVGMGGIGKTSLVRKVYQDSRMKKAFDIKLWVCVSDAFDVKKLFGLMLEAVGHTNIQLKSKEGMLKILEQELCDKRYLLVLDDIWNEDSEMWQRFKRPLEGISSASGSCIVLTTRLQSVASVAASDVVNLEALSDEHCWSIIKRSAFGVEKVPADMEVVGKEIAKKCKGLPLASQLVGGVLHGRGKEVWLSILKTNFSQMVGEEDTLNRILKLSYDHLPSTSLKKCFVFCSIFPKGHRLDRKQIIQLWMAEELLIARNRDIKMEDTGNDYFHKLVQHSLLQDLIIDEYGIIVSGKLHDHAHDMAHCILKAHVHSFGFVSYEEMLELRYLGPLVLDETKCDDMLERAKDLRSLMLLVKICPSSIDKFIHLRYLDLTANDFYELPDSVCKLYHLQTLKVPKLGKLPNDIYRLVSLRHLDISDYQSSTVFPRQFGKLTCLQTLNFFNPSVDNGGSMEELGSLPSLGGELCISNLQLVQDKEEAQMAGLNKKSGMRGLECSWKLKGTVCQNDEMHEPVLDGLEPHTSLKILKIKNYLGTRLPTWVKVRLPHNLVRLELNGCLCHEIPSLGRLKFLQDLELVQLDKVECIGPDFYSVELNSDANIQLFPALKRLRLRNMLNLKVWKEAQSTPTTNRGGGGGGIRIFPVLEELFIQWCPLLENAPTHFEILSRLTIDVVDSDVPVLNICSNLTSLVCLKISYVQELRCLPAEWLLNKDLESLQVSSCSKLTHIFPSSSSSCECPLKSLIVHDCPEFRDLPKSMYLLHCLRFLEVSECPKFISMPVLNGKVRLSSLRLLHVDGRNGRNGLSIPRWMLRGCPSLQYLVIGSRSPIGLHGPPLTHVTLLGLAHWDSLPDQIVHLSTLTCLNIFGFGIKDLPRGFDALTSLRSLTLYQCNSLLCLTFADAMPNLRVLKIVDCRSLKALLDGLGDFASLELLSLDHCHKLWFLPSRDAMQRLAKLQRVSIFNCPLLEENTKESGDNSHWHKFIRQLDSPHPPDKMPRHRSRGLHPFTDFPPSAYTDE